MHCFATRARAARRMAGTTTAALALLLSVRGVMAQNNAGNPAPANPGPANQTPLVIGNDAIDPNQPIKPNFILSVSVVGEPDPSGNYQVDQSGNVSVRYQGIQTPVSVKGLTPTQAADAIAKFLKTYIKNPQVTVGIVAVPRPLVYVGGAVKMPGPVTVTPDTTLLDLLSKAEWTENADLSAVRIIRHDKSGDEKKNQIIIVRFDKYLRVDPGTTPDESQNPTLQDKDSILVPLKSLPGNGVVSVFGEVTKPAQGIPLRMNPPMTVREVINLVGGTTQTANRKAISIRRATVDRPLVIDLEKAEQGDLVNNIELKPDDAVYVEKLENNAYINVNGGFVKTGKFVYDKRTTLTQAIMEAGGTAPFSKLNEGKIFRHPDNDPKHTQVIAFNWKEIENGKQTDLELQPGDSVWITPGQPPRDRPLDIFGIVSLLSSGAYLYNTLNNRRY